jgi:hypothetical protein
LKKKPKPSRTKEKPRSAPVTPSPSSRSAAKEPRQSSKAILAGLAIWTITLYFSHALFNQGRRESAAATWPVTEGVVTGWYIERGSDEGADYYYTPYLTYLYAVKEQAYENDSTHLWDHGPNGYGSYPTRADAEAALRRFPLGEETRVHYDPDKPWDAVLDLRKSAKENVWILFLIAPLGACITAYVFHKGGAGVIKSLGGVTLATALFLVLMPTFRGGAVEMDGGESVVAKIQAQHAAARAAWRSLSLGQKIAKEQIPPGGSSQEKVANGKTTVTVSYSGPSFERAGSLTLEDLKVIHIKPPFFSDRR